MQEELRTIAARLAGTLEQASKDSGLLLQAIQAEMKPAPPRPPEPATWPEGYELDREKGARGWGLPKASQLYLSGDGYRAVEASCDYEGCRSSRWLLKRKPTTPPRPTEPADFPEGFCLDTAKGDRGWGVPKKGWIWLRADYGRQVVCTEHWNINTRNYGWLLKPLPTVQEVYGRTLAELEPHFGKTHRSKVYNTGPRKGEPCVREPRESEWVLPLFSGPLQMQNNLGVMGNRLILEPLPAKPAETIESVYGGGAGRI